MTTEQLHKDFEQKFQKKAQHQSRGLTPDEIDIWLNHGQDSYIDGVINGTPGTREYNKRDRRTADIRAIKRTFVCDVMGESIPIPSDFMYLSGSSAIIQNKKTTSATSRYRKEFVAVVEFPKEAIGNTYLLSVNNVSVFSGEDYGFVMPTSSKDIPKAIDLLLDQELDGYELYWESYRDIYYANAIIVVTRQDDLATVDNEYEPVTDPSIDVLASAGTSDADFIGVNVKLTFGNKESLANFKQITYTSKIFLDSEETEVHTKDTDAERYSRVKNHPFKKTNSNSYLVDLNRDLLIGYPTNDIIATKLILNYYRKPRRISSRYGITCELNKDVHDEVVDIGVERLLAAIDSNRYQLKVNDNRTRNN